MNLRLFFSLIGLTASSVILTSCHNNQPTARHYVEITISAEEKIETSHELPSWHPPIGNMNQSMNNPELAELMKNSMAQIPLKWEVPEGWSEEKGSGMRLVTFRSNDSDPIECSIVSLGGMAGGLEANLKRWMEQIGLNVSNEKFNEFLKNPSSLKTKDGEGASLFDFTQLQTTGGDQAVSMMAIMLSTDETTIFVKMTGHKKAVLQNRAKFISLGESLHTNE